MKDLKYYIMFGNTKPTIEDFDDLDEAKKEAEELSHNFFIVTLYETKGNKEILEYVNPLFKPKKIVL